MFVKDYFCIGSVTSVMMYSPQTFFCLISEKKGRYRVGGQKLAKERKQLLQDVG